MNMNRAVLLAVLCVVLAVGCSDEYAGRMAVSGKVTLEGKPLNDADSMIMFEPIDGQDTRGGVKIVNGEYALERRDGLKPGQYLVRITSAAGGVPANEEEAAAPGGSTNILSMDRIPPEWNVRTDKQIEVKADGDNQFDFAIPKAYEPKARKKR
jgi:hypothetical protein